MFSTQPYIVPERVVWKHSEKFDTSSITKLEVISENGTVVDSWSNFDNIVLELQDDGKTLRVILK